MTINELLELLNAQARLPANRTITARMLEDWINEDLIPGPTRYGGTRNPNWQWSEESFSAALKVVEYRKRGFKRSAAIRAQWWLEHESFLSIQIIREDIIREFKRARNLLGRLISSSHGLRRGATLSEYRRRALVRQLGPLDPVFKQAGINPGGAVFILFYELARFGEQITPLDEDREPLAALLEKAVLPNGVHIFAGLLEDDETHPLSAVRSIRNLSSDQLKECRDCASMLPLALAVVPLILTALSADGDNVKLIAAAFAAARNSFDRWPWTIFAFGLAANIIYNSTLKPSSDL